MIDWRHAAVHGRFGMLLLGMIGLGLLGFGAMFGFIALCDEV